MKPILLGCSILLLSLTGVVAMATQPREHTKLPPERLAELQAMHIE